MNSIPSLSIVSHEGNAMLLRRINQLRPETKPVWGKMSVEKMFAHCSLALQSSLAPKLPKRTIIGYLLGGIFKKRILGPKGYGQNMPTSPEFVIHDERLFETERETLISLIKKYGESGFEIFPKDPHPMFGSMTPQEWDLFHAKHLDHHLRQFGA